MMFRFTQHQPCSLAVIQSPSPVKGLSDYWTIGLVTKVTEGAV